MGLTTNPTPFPSKRKEKKKKILFLGSKGQTSSTSATKPVFSYVT